MDTHPRPSVSPRADGHVGDLVRRIADDVKSIARGEVELARTEIRRSVRAAVGDAAIVGLGGLIALIGFGCLCVVAVVALAPVVPPLWLRLLLVAGAYLVLGGGLAAIFARRIGRDARPDLSAATRQARRTVTRVRERLARRDER